MADKKKPKAEQPPAVELEVVAETPVKPEMALELDKLAELDVSNFASGTPGSIPVEAAVLHPNPDVELLCIRLRSNGHGWSIVQRFEERAVGSHRHIHARKFLLSVTAKQLSALERVHGRCYPSLPFAGDDFDPKAVDVQTAIWVTPGSRRRILYVRYRDTWFPAMSWSRYSNAQLNRMVKAESDRRAAEYKNANPFPLIPTP